MNVNHDAARMQAFHILSREEQARAIRELRALGYGVPTIAHCTALSIEMVQRVLTEKVVA